MARSVHVIWCRWWMFRLTPTSSSTFPHTLMAVGWSEETAPPLTVYHQYCSQKFTRWRVSPRSERLPRLIRPKKVKSDLQLERAQWQPATPQSTRDNATVQQEVCSTIPLMPAQWAKTSLAKQSEHAITLYTALQDRLWYPKQASSHAVLEACRMWFLDSADSAKTYWPTRTPTMYPPTTSQLRKDGRQRLRHNSLH